MSGRPRPLVADGLLTPPRLDAEGYLDSVERCRSRFPELQILTGIAFGQPHLDEARAARSSTWTPWIEFRQAMRAIAATDRALELKIGGPIRPWIKQWWREEGGRAITIASDAHAPDGLSSRPPSQDFWRV